MVENLIFSSRITKVITVLKCKQCMYELYVDTINTMAFPSLQLTKYTVVKIESKDVLCQMYSRNSYNYSICKLT